MIRAALAVAVLAVSSFAGEIRQPVRLSPSQPVAYVQPAPAGVVAVRAEHIRYSAQYGYALENMAAVPAPTQQHVSVISQWVTHGEQDLEAWYYVSLVQTDTPSLGAFDGTVDGQGPSGAWSSYSQSYLIPYSLDSDSPVASWTTADALGRHRLGYTSSVEHSFPEAAWPGHVWYGARARYGLAFDLVFVTPD